MNNDRFQPNVDFNAFAYVGKAGIGNIDFSDDGNILFFMNLYDRKVYRLDLTAYFANGTMPTAANLSSISIPDPGCSGGSYRPFALKIKDGLMYVGIVCDAAISGSRSDLYAAVKSYNLTSSVWSDVFDFPLTYPKGYPDQSDGTKTGWFVWSDDPGTVLPGNPGEALHPVPMLSDIEFDMDGTMVIALMDRTAHQYGTNNADYWNGSSFSLSYIWLVAAGGDVLRAYYSNGAYVLENAAKAGPSVGYQTNNNQGPGFGEFYNDDIMGGVAYHTEMVTGGLALLPGSGEVMAGMVDPSFYLGGPLWANGTRRLSNTSGMPTGALAYYSNSGIDQFGKANGMGDLELASDNVNYIELGNYVWSDNDNNGIQDPDEVGVSGVTMKIYKASDGSFVGSVNTDGNGNYYFSTLNGLSILPNTAYNIVLGEGQYNGSNQTFTIGSTIYRLTPANTGQGSNPDLNDNDFSSSQVTTALGSQPAGLPYVSVTTGDVGYINHTIDVGLQPCIVDAGNDITLTCASPSGTIGTPGLTGYTYSWTPSTGLNDATLAQPTANPTTTTIYTLTVNGICTDIVTVTVNGNIPTADAGQDQTLTCTVTSVTIGTAAISGNTYSWNPSTGLNAANIAQPTASPTSTTSYTVTVTNGSGCTATDVVTVNVDTNPPTADAGQDKSLDCATTSTTIGTAAISGNTYSWNPSTGLNNATLAMPTASPTSTTTYTVTVTGSNGCTASDVMIVTVNTTPPVADAGQDKSLDCATTSTSIGTAAISGNTYSWNPSTGLNDATLAMPTASPTSTTTYTVTVTGSNGCTASDIMIVTVNTTPPPADAGQDKTIDCATTSVTIGTTAVSGLTYSWDPGNGLNDATLAMPTASPSATTIYTLTVTASNGCTTSDVVTVTVNGNLGSIGNYVWEDLNANGINDEPTTAGINGVSVELWKETAPGSGIFSSVNSTTTANNAGNPGYYSFSICDAANYKIKFPTTLGIQKLTLQTNAPATDANSDANPNDGFSPVFAIDPNASGIAKDNPTIDAGYFATACLGNYVWIDQVRDGIQNANEVGVAGITVMLFDNANTVVSTTVTNAYGFYHFCDLIPGDYHVGFTLPSNYVFTTQNSGSDDLFDNDADPNSGLTGSYTLQSGDDNLSVDAGIYFVQPTTASVGNYVWLDTNQDGIQDPNEVGISGVTVILYDNTGNAVATTITDGNGFYLFTNVTPGNYTIGFTPPPGLTFTPNNGTVSNPSNSDANPTTGFTTSFSVNAGDQITYVDAGLYQLPNNIGSLGDKVWFDTNQDGVQDPDESGVSDVTVTLFGSDGSTVLATTTTNTYGNYIFNNLPAGDYIVGFSNIPVDYTFTATTGTDSTTNSDADAISGKTNIIHLGAGQHNMTYDAGIYNTNPANTNSIGNYVWYDINKNGIQDASETGVPGITATLYDNANTPIKSTSTDAFGFYLFPDLPNGTYYVGFSNIPDAYQFTAINAGADDAVDSDVDPSSMTTASTTLTGNTNDMTLDAGIYANNNRLGKGTLGDKVWYDLNGNGLQDPTESGVVGVTVTLFESDGSTVIATTMTDALGNYIFTGLDQGAYIVGFSNLPSGFSISPQNSDAQGVNGELNSDVNPGTQQTPIVVLAQGEDKMSVDMGLVPPPGSAGLGNYVWVDLNNDGLQSSGEPGVAGVTVTLYANNEPAGVTTTDSRGLYQFIGLTPGSYSVGFSNLPSGYVLTTQNADALGINGADNSDADITSGLTAPVTLAAGDFNPNLDAGINSTTVASLGDYVWIDLDADGIQDTNEPGVGGILVTLFDNATNNPITSMVTNPEGGYLFTNLQAGTYYLTFSNIPSGMVFTTQEANPNDASGSNVDPLTGRTPAVVLLAGTHNPTIDAGLKAPGTAGLGDFVWHDVNKNGQQNAGEPAIAGVLVTLYDGTGTNVLATSVTDGAGKYGFANLNAGDYILGFTAPTLFTPEGARVPIPTTLNSGADVSDNDADPISGRTGAYTLAVGEYNPTIDAGFFYQFATPVSLSSFQASTNACAASLYWTTSMEKNADHFVLYRKQDNAPLVEIATIKAFGNSNIQQAYSFTDRNVNSGNYDYQLQVVDIDGNFTWSDLRAVNVDCGSSASIQIFPNPVDDVLTLQIIAEAQEITDVALINALGQVVVTQQHPLEIGNNILHIPMKQLAMGTYYLKVNMNGATHTLKLTKQ